ncbi:unnamed protein product [Rotaria sp. Silwood2]|nr:unnamed protein product [Rotaria sp. Silwood2]CAF4369678.1 unnamed protein product [Rotaria sp. Silwood2]
MSNLPIQTAVNHNDDNDEQTNSTNNKLSTINSRITSPLIIKRQQNTETEIANNQAYDEIHDLQPKHFLAKKINNDNSYMKNSTRQYQSHELMQGNYYDQTRFDNDYSSSSNHQSEPILININVEDYKKTFAPVCTSKNSNNKNRTRSPPPFGDTSESIQQGIAQSAGILLELNKKQDNHQQQHQHKTIMKNNNKSHEQAVINYFPNDDDDNNKQRSSSSSSSDCSTSDSSTSNKSQDDNTKTNIGYEKLLNEDDNDEELIEQTKKPLTESTTLLNKNHTQTYGTQQSTTNTPYERSKYLPNNGYNSHGSSITTKSSSDNSGSIRTNSGTDNDEESDEEPYNNSTLSNNPHSMTSSRTKDTSMKSLNKTNDIQYSYLNEQDNYQSSRSNTTRVEQISNNEPHLQVPRMKQLHIDDLNGNVNKLNPTTTDHNTIFFPSKSSLQQSSNNQTNISSSSHQNRNLIERNEQQQNHSNSSRNNIVRQNQNRGSKKRKQSQQQEIIRTELIPGHRGDRDVDELVMFIDGDSSKQRQNSTPLRPTDTNKPRLSSKINSVDDTNSNKTSSRKKSRKSINILQETISTTNDDNNNNNENQTSNYVTTSEQNIQSINFIDEDNQTKTHTIIDITNQSLLNKNISTDNNDESHLNTVDVNSTKTINDESSIPNLFEQVRSASLKNDDIDSYSLSSTITNNLNSEIISEPFVTVKNRRRLIKERRQDNNLLTRSTHFLPPSTSSKTHDKRRILSTTKNGIIRPIIRNNLPNAKFNSSSITKEEITNNRISSEPIRPVPPPPSDEPLPSSSIVNSTNEQTIEKQQISPRLSSHSSSSSLSSLLKRQSKLPPVIFLNKSNDIELNDVSFGFELDSTTLNKSSDDTNTNNQPLSTTTEPDIDTSNTLTSPLMQPIQSNDILNDSFTQKSPRKFSQRNNRSPQFYSGSDIRPHQQRNYSSQSSYIDPLLVLQYNQRLANYSQQLAYMNLLRQHYMSPQSQYIFLPTTYTTTTANESDQDETTNSTTPEQIQESLLVYSTPTGQFYFHPSTTKKSSIDTEQQSNSIPNAYTPTIYPSHYYYPSQAQHLTPSQTAYFQPISSSLNDTKSEQNNIDLDDDDDKNSSVLYHQARQLSSSSDIMSNALQLVYSQQRRNAQTDRFNLDDLTAYLAMKWTDTVDHYEQGISINKNK